MVRPRKNTIGGQLRKVRSEKRLSQAGFAAVCQRNGWNISRETVARIEGCVRCVSDFELLLLAENLEVAVTALLPGLRNWKKERRSFLQRYD